MKARNLNKPDAFILFGFLIGIGFVIFKKFFATSEADFSKSRILQGLAWDYAQETEIINRELFTGAIVSHIEKYKNIILKESAKHSNIFPELVAAVISKESAGNPRAQGKAGEVGLMQISFIALEDYNKRFRKSYQLEDLLIPEINIEVGSGFLSMQIERMGNDTYGGVRAYNAGERGAKENTKLSITYANDVFKRAENLIKLGYF